MRYWKNHRVEEKVNKNEKIVVCVAGGFICKCLIPDLRCSSIRPVSCMMG